MIAKLAFLFLTINSIYHEALWTDFFALHESQYSIYVHPKKPLEHDSFFKPFELSQTVETTWANTMNAQIELLKEALKDSNNEKFIFVSESTIPLQSFDYIYEVLMAHSKSQFFFEPNYHSVRVWRSIAADDVLKNSQWIVLNRKHAELMVSDTELITHFIASCHDQEHYPSTLLARHQLLDEVIKRNTTLDIWHYGEQSPYTFTDLATDRHMNDLIIAINEKKFLFARKFGVHCDLLPLLPYLSWANQSK